MAVTLRKGLRLKPRHQAGLTTHRPGRTRFEVYGEEMREKVVRPSGSSGRIYLPQEWVGKTVKVVRLD